MQIEYLVPVHQMTGLTKTDLQTVARTSFDELQTRWDQGLRMRPLPACVMSQQDELLLRKQRAELLLGLRKNGTLSHYAI
jgi:hypothetical protein